MMDWDVEYRERMAWLDGVELDYARLDLELKTIRRALDLARHRIESERGDSRMMSMLEDCKGGLDFRGIAKKYGLSSRERARQLIDRASREQYRIAVDREVDVMMQGELPASSSPCP